MQFAPAPLNVDAVRNAGWLGEALSRGSGRRVDVAGFKELECLGPSALKLRMRIDYASGQGDLPDQICIKGIFDPALSTWLTSGAQQAEALFYRDIAPRLSVRVPRGLYAGYDEATMAGHVIMEDMIPKGVRFLSAMSPYSIEQMRGSLDQLARLHGGSWSADPAAEPWIRSKLAQFAGGAIMPADALSALMQDGRGEGLPDRLLQGETIFAAIEALSHRDLPSGFVHGDCHAGNVFDGPEGIGLVDWQVLQRGHWSLDVAYHMAAALSVDDRRAHEDELLRHYLAALAQHGGSVIALDDARDQLAQAFPYGLLLWGVTRRVEAPIVRRFVERLGTACADHDSLSRLGL